MADEKEPKKRPSELAQARERALHFYGYGDYAHRDPFILGWMARAEFEKAHPLVMVSIPLETRRE